MTDRHTHQTEVVGGLPELLGVSALLACAVSYLWLARRARDRNPAQGWSGWRSASFIVGLLLVAAAILPPVATVAHADFRGHMVSHLLVGMYAPIALVLGAPSTLLLRGLRPSAARRLSAALRSRVGRVVTHPATALLLSSGGLAVLYFTPAYDALTGTGAGHWLLHVHFLAAGCLFAFAIAGPDPAPARPGVTGRLAYLGVAVAAHATMSQLIYGGFGARIAAPVEQVQGGAQIMYYGGDIAELLLAAAVVATWRPGVHKRHGGDACPPERAAWQKPSAPQPRQAGSKGRGSGVSG